MLKTTEILAMSIMVSLDKGPRFSALNFIVEKEARKF